MYEVQEEYEGGASGGGVGGGGGAGGGASSSIDTWRNSYYTRLQMNAFSPVVGSNKVYLCQYHVI